MSPSSELLNVRVVLVTLDNTLFQREGLCLCSLLQLVFLSTINSWHVHTLSGDQTWQFCPPHKAVLMLVPLKGRTTEAPSFKAWAHSECK